MSKFPDFLNRKEGEVINRLITAAFEAGLEIQVEYGEGMGGEEDLAVPYTTDRAAIQAETAATGITLYRLRETGAPGDVGVLMLVHGNAPWEVLADFSASDQAGLDRLGKIFDPVIDRCEALYG